MTIITLTTDFGASDGYAGAMKGVILGIAPDTVLVDISHDIPPQDIRAGAFVLKAASPYFPSGTIHIAVVDPGVGSHRRMLAVRTRRALFVGPDNGVLSWACEEDGIQEITHITDSRYWLQDISHTFHGRDVFAPVAAHLARGVPQQRMGDPTDDIVRLPLPLPQIKGDNAVHGEVIYIDHFGNLVSSIRVSRRDYCITNLPGRRGAIQIGPGACIEILGHRIASVADTYADASPGELVALVGSSGHLEVALRDGNAASRLKGYVGAPVRVVFPLKGPDTSLP